MANRAAWLPAPAVNPFKIDDAPMPIPKANEVVIKNRAIAINPADWGMQAFGGNALPYPYILGCDTAGEISAVGSAVKNFKIGDRVVAIMIAFKSGNVSNSAFQLFSLAPETCISKIPENISYAEASVLPLAICTAASGLFMPETLALPYPQVNPEPKGEVVLVWGGSSSVGACAIQLLVAAGYDVATTASSQNLEDCKALGAKYVFDRAKETIVEDITTALKGSSFGGAFCSIMDPNVVKQCALVATELGGRKFVSTVFAPVMPLPDDLPSTVKYSKAESLSIFQNELGKAIWEEWMPTALADGSLKCVPPPLVVGQGLDAIQGACDRWKQGVSFKKVVVELP